MAIGSSRAMCHSEAGKLASQPKHDVATYTVCHTRLKKHNISFDMICPLLRISFYLYCPNLKNRLLVLKGFPKTHKYISSFSSGKPAIFCVYRDKLIKGKNDQPRYT